MSEQIPETVYHYCSLSSFYSIVKNKNIRLSCHVSTNDYYECTWIDHILNGIVEDSEVNKEFADKVIHQFISNREFSRRSRDIYLACFSEHGDRLSQWRAYADDGRGVAIGFNTRATGFAELFNKDDMKFGKVIYAKDQQVRAVKDILKKRQSEYDPTNSMEPDVVLCALDLGKVAPLIKNHAFEEEGEYRLMYQPDIGYDTLGNFEADNGLSEIKFHVNRSGLYPYFEFPFSQDNLLHVISDVKIGPRTNQEPVYIEFFLRSHGFHPGITLSTASYR